MKVSEDFYSVQGEGDTQGVPAYFVRLQGCNLMCGGTNGNMVKAGMATWHCDTEKTWKYGKEKSNERLLERMQNSGALEKLLTGKAHVVWTGGEPAIPYHQNSIINFANYTKSQYPSSKMYHEIETNGTIPLSTELNKYIDQINCSPKLSNSGMKLSKRRNGKAMRTIKKHRNHWWKFVIGDMNDIREMEHDWIHKYNLDKNKVILMPAAETRDELVKGTQLCYEVTKDLGYRTISRGHILAWDRTVGV